MISRALWTTVLALLAWIPIGRGNAWAFRGDLRDRALFSVSALEVAADSPARTASQSYERVTFVAHKRPAAPRSLVPMAGATPFVPAAVARVGRNAPRQISIAWRGFREKRLSFPHDAIAPPANQS